MIGSATTLETLCPPALFILLARRAGQILTDPVAMRAWNDALNPEEQVATLMGKKLGEDFKGVEVSESKKLWTSCFYLVVK
mgnify:CR=1 FL=1